jgi:hypothetical protein
MYVKDYRGHNETLEVSRFLKPVLAAVSNKQLPGVLKLRRRFIQ